MSTPVRKSAPPTGPSELNTPTDFEPKHPQANCHQCPLYEKGRFVPSEFPTDGKARLAFLGEAPAKTEVVKKRPFVGPSGQLLDRVLEHYSVRRDQVLLTNAALCQYPNTFDSLPLAAIEACRPRLQAELEETGVETVVAMGNSAIQSAGTKDARKVTSYRAGPPKPSRFPNIDLVPTFHPAACLRNHGNFPHMVADTGKAISIDPPQNWYEPEIIIVEPEHVGDAITKIIKLNRGQGIVVDTESGNDKDSAYGNTHLANLLCMGVGPLDPSNYDRVFVFTQEVMQNEFLRSYIVRMLNECGVIAHNGKYDLGVLNAALNTETPIPLLFDTMLAHYAIDERGGIHGLKYLATEFLGTPDYEADIKGYVKGNASYANIPTHLLHEYNAYDVHATRLLYAYFSNQIEEQGLTKILEHLHRVSGMLQTIETKGLGFDQEYSDTLEARLLEEQERTEGTIPFNPRSHVQVKKYFTEFNIKLPDTREETLTHLVEKLQDNSITKVMVERILKARGYTKMLSTYVTGLQEKVTDAGTIHPTFLLHGTTTGRLSSRNPNAQNIPRAKELKRQFIPSSPDRVFIQCDYSQAELRTLTWLAGEEGLRDLFNDPTKDIFIELCRDMFPTQWDTWDKVQKKEIRTLIKTFAYGISYGRTAAGIAADPAFNMTIQEAEGHMRKFQQRIPNIMEFQKDVIARIHRGEDLINPFGRRRRFYLITDQNQVSVHNEAMAYLPQSTASDICLEAACRLQAQGVDIRNLVHDAILAESAPDEAQQIQQLMSSTMAKVAEEVVGGYVDFDTDGEIGTSWDQV